MQVLPKPRFGSVLYPPEATYFISDIYIVTLSVIALQFGGTVFCWCKHSGVDFGYFFL